MAEGMDDQGHAPEPTRAGFVAVIGAPNVGKSTLVNRLVGAKVSIVSPKVQTTRTRVLGIFLKDAAQVVLMDTPGVFEPKRRLDRTMVSAAWSGADEGDHVLLLVDAGRGLDGDTEHVLARLKAHDIRVTLGLNKVDKVEKPKLLSLAERLQGSGVVGDVFMISALKGGGVDDLAAHLAANVPEGPWLFPEDEISDLPARLLAAEITREQLYLQLHQELPYAAAVETETWDSLKDGSAKVRQVIFVERDSQKGIVLGKGGSKIKSIGQAARKELGELLGTKIHLVLHVKVQPRWGDDPAHYRLWGLDPKA